MLSHVRQELVAVASFILRFAQATPRLFPARPLLIGRGHVACDGVPPSERRRECQRMMCDGCRGG